MTPNSEPNTESLFISSTRHFLKVKKLFLQSLRSDRVTTEIASRGSLVGIWCGHWGIALLCKITSSLCAQIFNACTSGLKRFILVSFLGFNYSKNIILYSDGCSDHHLVPYDASVYWTTIQQIRKILKRVRNI